MKNGKNEKSGKTGFKDLVDNISIGVFQCTLGFNPKFLYVNPSFCEMMHLSASEIMKLSLLDIFEDRQKFRIFKKNITADGSIKDFSVRIGGRSGQFFWGSLSAIASKDKQGKIQYVDVCVEDVSAKSRFEKDLIESKGLFQTVFNNTAAAITVTDKYEKIVAWNPFAEKMLGMDQEDLFNKPVEELYPPSEWKRLRSLNVRKKGVLSDIEAKIKKKDGDVLDVSVSISILKDLDGNIMGSIGIMNDITNLKVATRKVQESEAKVRAVLDNTAAAIIQVDSEERIVSWNKFTEKMLGAKKKDLFMRKVSSLYPRKEWQKIRSEKIRDKGAGYHIESKIIKQNGDIIDVDLSINILKDSNDKITGSVGIMQDITQRKKFQEMLVSAKLAAEQANSAKSMFLANMSHEVRTPMNAIMGMLDLTLDTELSEEQKDNLVVAKESADNLLGLINDILDLSKVEAGKISLENIEFHLHNIVRNVVKGLSVIAKDKNLKLEVDIEENVPELIKGDPVRLRQIIINLVNNAIKFTSEGKITVGIKLESIRDKQAVLLFYVKDEGIGIPKDKHKTVFEIFAQADDSTTRKFGGTGLGLAICKRLVEMMNGTIWIESEVGQGSTFLFTGEFDIVDKDASEVGKLYSEEKEEVNENAAADYLKILLAEDNIVNQKIAARMLEKFGWNVYVVENGKLAVEQYQKESYDVILMDAQMPEMNGFEATAAIREREKETGGHMPIIALTARAMAEDRQICIDAGMDGYVAKPIDRTKLFDEVVKLVKKGK